jgi:hypothetical protein
LWHEERLWNFGLLQRVALSSLVFFSRCSQCGHS